MSISKENSVLFWTDDIKVIESPPPRRVGVEFPEIIVLFIIKKGGYFLTKKVNSLASGKDELVLPSFFIEDIAHAPSTVEKILNDLHVSSKQVSLIESMSLFPERISTMIHIYFVQNATVEDKKVTDDYMLVPLNKGEDVISQRRMRDALSITIYRTVMAKFYSLLEQE